MSEEKKQKRGFAVIDEKKRREIASKGGKAAHAKGTAHKWTSDEARVAGSKGGKATRRRPAVPPVVPSEVSDASAV